MTGLWRISGSLSQCIDLRTSKESVLSMNDYHNKFSPSVYLETRYKRPGEKKLHDFPTQHLHTFFSDVQVSPTSEYKVLDYGCGPVLANVISAAKVATEVVLAEYTEKNRLTVQQWLDKGPTAWNWRPFFEHIVVTLEGKSPHEAIEREEYLRSIIQAVVPCDITQDPPITEGFEGPYDAVISLLSIETGCRSLEEYKCAVKRVHKLIKSGSFLILFSTLRNDTSALGWYKVGTETFTEIPLTLQFVHATLKEANLHVLKTESLELPEYRHLDGTAFIVARKP